MALREYVTAPSTIIIIIILLILFGGSHEPRYVVTLSFFSALGCFFRCHLSSFVPEVFLFESTCNTEPLFIQYLLELTTKFWTFLCLFVFNLMHNTDVLSERLGRWSVVNADDWSTVERRNRPKVLLVSVWKVLFRWWSLKFGAQV